MTADTLAAALSSLAAVVVPLVGSWAWKANAAITEHTTILIEREKAEVEWKTDLKDRLVRIEEKLDEPRRS